MVHLKDVARIELGGENYNMVTKINGRGSNGAGDQAGDWRKRAGYRCRHQE